MSKKPQHSTNPEEIDQNRSPYFDEWHDLFTFQKKPAPYGFIVELAGKVRVFADKKTTLRVNDFYDSIGMSPDDYYRFKKRCPELQAAHAYLKRKIASRRDIGALMRKFDAGWTAKNQGRYDPGYLRNVQREASLKAQVENKQAGITNVFMDGIKIASTEISENKDE